MIPTIILGYIKSIKKYKMKRCPARISYEERCINNFDCENCIYKDDMTMHGGNFLEMIKNKLKFT